MAGRNHGSSDSAPLLTRKKPPARKKPPDASLARLYLEYEECKKPFCSQHILECITANNGTQPGYLSLTSYLLHHPGAAPGHKRSARLDPYVRAALSQEPVEVQRAALAVLMAIKCIARSLSQQKMFATTGAEVGEGAGNERGLIDRSLQHPDGI